MGSPRSTGDTVTGRFRLAAVANVLVSGLGALILVVSSPVPVGDALTVLREHAHPAYAAWLVAAVGLPVVLLLAALIVRWTPWPWVVLVTVHLVAVVAVAVRLRHWTDGVTWSVVSLVVALGLASVFWALETPRSIEPRP